MEQRIYIVVLNYNNWMDTLACAESILANRYRNFRLIIVDNASTDNSMHYIRAWAEGDLESWTPPKHPLHALSFPPAAKPLDYLFFPESDYTADSDRGQQVILIQADANRGYSAGNNIGIRYARQKADYDAIWILNNDTVIAADALQRLVACAEARGARTGLLGTTLLFYDAPDKIQAFGARFNPFLSVQKHFLAHRTYSKALVAAFDQNRLDYIVGASIFLTRRCIERIGLMPEEYFLYFEEIDIALQCRRKGMDFAICSDAVVYHKESVSIKQENRRVNAFSDFYALRNRLLIAQKYHPRMLPTVYAGLLFSLILRLKRREFQSVRNILKIMTTRPSRLRELSFR